MLFNHRVHIGVEEIYGIAEAHTATLLVMVDTVKEGGRAPPPSSPACADLTLMMECTPESGRCHSVLCVLNTARSGTESRIFFKGLKMLPRKF
jgi:hypothetical protein